MKRYIVSAIVIFAFFFSTEAVCNVVGELLFHPINLARYTNL